MTHLSRRERQIMDAIYAAERATAADVLDAIADPPSYSAVRALLRILEDKGHLTHVKDGARYVYVPTQPRAAARQSALRQVLQTFFGGSVEAAVATLLTDADAKIPDDELVRLAALIEKAREGDRP